MPRRVMFHPFWGFFFCYSILKIDRKIYKSFVDIVKMSFYMDLSHIGIHWKTVVDQETLDDPASNC